MDFNYSKLKGIMAEKGVSQSQLAKLSDMSLSSLNLKLNKNRAFTQEDIYRIVVSLNLKAEDIPRYFFNLKTCILQVD